ncbi:MAG: hypothetical protein MUE49_08180 [Rhodospirillales bacterium]|jgi:hypothetical protein|nr:hypothetical protein [Rhodospirillales bacterium]
MPRKPNYRFERMEKDRVKAQKKAERLKAKQERAASRQPADGDGATENAADGDGGGADTAAANANED